MTSSNHDFLAGLSKDVDSMIAMELSAMSMQEREQSYFDIHGVSDVIDETPEFLEEKLREFDEELAKIAKDRCAYSLAEAQDKEYVRSNKFRFKFLRANNFDARLAAERVIRFFKEKLNLFGVETLARDIKMSDLGQEGRRWLESGIGQLVPQRDRSGRCVIAWILPPNDAGEDQEQSGMNKIRVLFYLLMAASQDEETQKKGIVGVVVNMGENRRELLDLEAAKKVPALALAIPLRFACVHFCVDNSLAANALAVFAVLVGTRERVRFRTHLGSYLEVRYELMTYGISMNMFPLTDEGECPLDNHRNWMVKQHTLESITFTNEEREILDDAVQQNWDAEVSSDCNLSSSPSNDTDALAANYQSVNSKENRELRFSDSTHCISDAIDETPEFLEANLAKLENELANMSKTNKEVYLQAEAQDDRYTRCRKLRLMFLRAESFDVRKAAERLARFFKEKLNLFGPGLLAKDVKLSDLDANDIKCLESGIGQLLPHRDRAGRCIFAWIKTIANETIDNAGDIKQIAKNKARVLYYMLMAAVEDEETQKQGMVGIAITIGNKQSFQFETARSMCAVAHALPNRWPTVHFCVDDQLTANALLMWVGLMGSREGARFRAHIGTYQEVRYELMSYGIPMNMFPVTDNGEFQLDDHHTWVAQRQKLECPHNTNDEGAIVPGPHDIIMGRHWEAQLHEGNIRFRDIVAKHWEAYDAAMKHQKKHIAETVVQDVKAAGSRFLKSDGAGYLLVDDIVAREKTSSAFRDRRKMVLADEKRKASEMEEQISPGPADKSCGFGEVKRTKWSLSK